MAAADQPAPARTDAEPVSFLAAAAALAAIDDACAPPSTNPGRPQAPARPARTGPGRPPAAAQIRDQLAGWEAGLVETARAAGATWADLAHPMGVASRQAAENRYLRRRPRTRRRPPAPNASRPSATAAPQSAPSPPGPATTPPTCASSPPRSPPSPTSPARPPTPQPTHAALAPDDAADLITPSPPSAPT